ncbi:hypothetical protein DV711_06305 [Motiliproteus coralliicola]|uniref:Uncharacterized protein n=1 Tax=Motiliproteus coralliicola TaxID=2283196 RepID=A0A369X066_9GAMM|nr:hypothetical protein [Motiliproteus coralliicola]RDE25165.1 hypothetical protein DV711_06305 [Motiliproteus coralliicola]
MFGIALNITLTAALVFIACVLAAKALPVNLLGKVEAPEWLQISIGLGLIGSAIASFAGGIAMIWA